jgi:outer membrane protein assembly factor BamD
MYKLNEIKAYYKYAEMSIEEKQLERYSKVLDECSDFNDRFADSKLMSEMNIYKTESQNKINKLQNEQAKTTTQR